MSLTTLGLAPQQLPHVSECGTPPVDVIDRTEAERRATLLKAVADPVRIQLLSFISSSPDQEACVCDMTGVVQVSQPTVSHHLKTLVEAGLLTRERRGSWAWFRLEAGVLRDIRGFLS